MTKPVELLVMRLADMVRVHPKQIVSRCSKCGEAVGVYPSGQRIMKEYALLGGVKLVCQVCRGEHDLTILAPGAMEEASESKRKDN